MNLWRAELRRLARRRLSMIFGLLAMGAVLLLTVVMWSNSRTGPDQDQLAEAQAQAEDEREAHAECVADESYFENSSEDAWLAEDPYYSDMPHEQVCEELFVADAEAEDFVYVYTFQFDQEGTYMTAGIGIVVGLLSMMLAASAIGAEWSSGGFANLLVWHPGRMRVWGAKLAASLAVCAVAVVAFMALTFALLYLTASVRGQTGTLDAVWWTSALGVIARTGVLALGMAVLGAGLAMLGRHTAIAGGVVAGYLIVGELAMMLAAGVMRLEFPELLSLYTWVGAWVNGSIELQSRTGEVDQILTISATQAGLLLGGILAVISALATWSFTKRDVT